MKKRYTSIIVAALTLAIFLMSATHTSTAAVDNGLTKMSQLLDPDVVASLDGDGDGKAEITGIDPGAGMMVTLDEFISGNSTWSESWEILDSSDASMTAELDTAVNKDEPIVVTLWSPHWAFNKYDLTYLEDDVGLYGSADTVVTLARQGLDTDRPALYNIIERFEWSHEDIQAVMLAIENGDEPDVAAQAWVDANTDKVNTWIGTDSAPDNTPVDFGYVAWSGEIASTNVMKLVLEEAGFTVNLVLLQPAALYAGLADDSVDFTVSAWLPLTQASYWEDQDYKSQIDWVNENLVNAKVGLVVPTYMADGTYEFGSTSAPGFEIPMMIIALVGFNTIRKRKNK